MKTIKTKNKVQKQNHPPWHARDSPVGTLNGKEFCGDI